MIDTPRLRELIRFAEKRAESSLTYATEKTCRDTAAALAELVALRERVEGFLRKFPPQEVLDALDDDQMIADVRELRAAIAEGEAKK